MPFWPKTVICSDALGPDATQRPSIPPGHWHWTLVLVLMMRELRLTLAHEPTNGTTVTEVDVPLDCAMVVVLGMELYSIVDVLPLDVSIDLKPVS